MFLSVAHLFLACCLGGGSIAELAPADTIRPPIDGLTPSYVRAANDPDPTTDPIDAIIDDDDRDETHTGSTPRGEFLTSLLPFQAASDSHGLLHLDYRRLNAVPPPLIYSLCVLQI